MDTNEQVLAPAQEASAKPFSSGTVYGGFTQRAVAAFIDGLLTIPVMMALTFMNVESDIANALASIAYFVYVVVMLNKQGATLGKAIMKIKVQDKDTGANLSIGKAILRESIGKTLSGLVLWLGFFWMLWDKNKQTWHDMIANSVVVKTQE